MNPKSRELGGPGVMLFSALLFGYFGFTYTWGIPGVDGKTVLFPLLLGWTLKVSSIIFLVSAGLAMVNQSLANLLYALAGVASAGLFVVVAVMDFTDENHMIMPYGIVVLLFFAGLNGFGSWSALRAVLSGRGSGTADGVSDEGGT